MRDYGKVHSSFWTSSTIRGMSEDGRTLALYLLTCPHNTIAGVFRLPDGYACEDLQWTSERVAKGFMELLAKGFANRCETTKWVWIYKHLEWNPPENPNQRKAVNKMAMQVPDDCEWKQAFRSNVAPVPCNPSETLSEPFLNQEQEQEQEQELEPLSASPPPAKKKRACLVPFTELPGDYRAEAYRVRPDLDQESVTTLGEQFIDHHRQTGTLGKDWLAGWRTWLRNDQKFHGGKKPAPRASVPTTADGMVIHIARGPSQ